eukprot:scaffold3283_cov430-Prasinococcus_capsulatus_cf.AAC.3
MAVSSMVRAKALCSTPRPVSYAWTTTAADVLAPSYSTNRLARGPGPRLQSTSAVSLSPEVKHGLSV